MIDKKKQDIRRKVSTSEWLQNTQCWHKSRIGAKAINKLRDIIEIDLPCRQHTFVPKPDEDGWLVCAECGKIVLDR